MDGHLIYNILRVFWMGGAQSIIRVAIMDEHVIYNIPQIMDCECAIYNSQDIVDSGCLINNIPPDYGWPSTRNP
jgi:hypothetical protein